MASFSDMINRLFDTEEWAEARRLLEAEHVRKPADHWVLTQLGVTFYEQGRYAEALRLFLKSRKILPECPLTLWHLAGAYDMLGRHRQALPIYTSLIECQTTPEEFACWESREWGDGLKADCAYRVAGCFEQLGNKSAAEHCFRQYIDLLLLGIKGLYPIEDARLKIESLNGHDKWEVARVEFRNLATYLTRIQGENVRVKPRRAIKI